MTQYRKIANDLIQMIKQQSLLSGTKLPSIINELAYQYCCSKGTVIKAYETLVTKHIVYSKPRSGYFVADDLVRPEVTKAAVYDLSTGNIAVDSIPLMEMKH